jgi:hypothetical protein
LTHFELIGGVYVAVAADLNSTQVTDATSLFNTLVHEMVHVRLPVSLEDHGDAFEEEARRVLAVIENKKTHCQVYLKTFR